MKLGTISAGIVTASALVAFAAPASAAPSPSASPHPKLCYEVQDQDSNWLEFCDGAVAAPKGGLFGLDSTLENVSNTSVHYNAYFAGKWSGEEKNGGKVGNGVDKITGLKVLIS